MMLPADVIDIRMSLNDEGFVMNFVPPSNVRILPQCEVVEVYYVPLDCKQQIHKDQRKEPAK